MNSILNGTTLSARDQPLIGAVNSAGVLSAEIADVVVVELLDDRLHLLVLAGAGAEVYQLPLDELIGLRCKRGNVLHLRNTVLAVAADAHLGLGLAGRDIGGGVGGRAK